MNCSQNERKAMSKEIKEGMRTVSYQTQVNEENQMEILEFNGLITEIKTFHINLSRSELVEKNERTRGILIQIRQRTERKKKMKHEQNLRKCGTPLSAPSCVSWEYQERKHKIFEEMMAQNVPNLLKINNLHMKEAQHVG